MTLEQVDVAVVGAGPAGAAAALAARRSGASVLLLDKAGFPRDKPCGDARLVEFIPRTLRRTRDQRDLEVRARQRTNQVVDATLEAAQAVKRKHRTCNHRNTPDRTHRRFSINSLYNRSIRGTTTDASNVSVA